MEDKVKILDLDFVFISYKEPKCEEHYADLLNKVPWAKRVHGVKGFDNAHKAAADLAETDFFISIDGDNLIDESFLLQTLDWTKTNPKHVHRWRAKNVVNGLIYGNGGIVGWHKETCLGMKTHENAVDEKGKRDFCWTVPHANLHNCYSTTIINGSDKQAFIAGYREGVKLSMNQGQPIDPKNFKKDVVPSNMVKLMTWMSVGADVECGKYAMLGARVGCYDLALTATAESCTLELSELEKNWELWQDKVDTELEVYKNSLTQRLGLNVVDLDANSSKFFKFTQPTHINRGVQDLEN
jgi:hypothetical protein